MATKGILSSQIWDVGHWPNWSNELCSTKHSTEARLSKPGWSLWPTLTEKIPPFQINFRNICNRDFWRNVLPTCIFSKVYCSKDSRWYENLKTTLYGAERQWVVDTFSRTPHARWRHALAEGAWPAPPARRLATTPRLSARPGISYLHMVNTLNAVWCRVLTGRPQRKVVSRQGGAGFVSWVIKHFSAECHGDKCNEIFIMASNS